MGLKDYEGSSSLGVESSGDEEHSEAIVVEVAEAAGEASVEFDEAVDRLGVAVAGAMEVIHTDFQKGFIKAQVVSFDDLVAAGSETAAKAAGKMRLEGKDYVMQDGDVVEFRFNV